VRVGVIGLTRANPALQKAGPEGSTLVVADPAKTLEALLPDLRAASDVVVLLAAMPDGEARVLAATYPGIDVVLGAAGGTVSPEETTEGKTAVRYTGVQGRFLGEVRLALTPDRKITSTVSRAHQLDPRYPSDPEMAAYLERTLAALPRASLAPLEPVH
jgi:2',3'-cyclic-nucleotide 2'-phosphodiesterase (5'-nucleotidase family)